MDDIVVYNDGELELNVSVEKDVSKIKSHIQNKSFIWELV
jgi:hypothetical protein